MRIIRRLYGRVSWVAQVWLPKIDSRSKPKEGPNSSDLLEIKSCHKYVK